MSAEVQQVTMSLLAGVTVSLHTAHRGFKHALSAPVSLGPSKVSGTEVETNMVLMNKKTSSFRSHLLLLYGNSLINVMAWFLILYFIRGIISGERKAAI